MVFKTGQIRNIETFILFSFIEKQSFILTEIFKTKKKDLRFCKFCFCYKIEYNSLTCGCYHNSELIGTNHRIEAVKTNNVYVLSLADSSSRVQSIVTIGTNS